MKRNYVTHWKHSLCNRSLLEYYNILKYSYTPSTFLDLTTNPYIKLLPPALHHLENERIANSTSTPTPNIRPSPSPYSYIQRALGGLAARRRTWRISAFFLVLLGSFVAQAKAVPDPVTYELSPDVGNLFAINSTTGNISVKGRFDREVCRTRY